MSENVDPQYYRTLAEGYRQNIGAGGQGSIFDTQGNAFYYSAPNADVLNKLRQDNHNGPIDLSADNSSMMAFLVDGAQNPFYTLNIPGNDNYETSEENIVTNSPTIITPTPKADAEVKYSKTGNVWEFKFNEQNRGLSGYNLAGQSSTNADAIHQLSNVAANIVGSDLKTQYSAGNYSSVDVNNIKMEYGKDSNSKTYYYITIPLTTVTEPKASLNFDHRGSWSTSPRPTYTAKQNALTNIYGDTPFDTPPNAPTTWNFPKTDVNSTSANKGWPGFNDIKQKYPFDWSEKSTGNDNNIYEFWIQWRDTTSITPVTNTTPAKQPNDEKDFGLEGFQVIEEQLPTNENNPIYTIIGKAADNDEELVITKEDVQTIDFNIGLYINQTTTSGGNYNSINDVVLASTTNTPDGKLYSNYMYKYVYPNEGSGGKAEAGDSGGLTVWGLTYKDSWKPNAAKVFPGIYKGTPEELISLANEAGKPTITVIGKVVYFDPVLKGSDSNVPDIFKIMALQDSWGGQNLLGKGNTWKNAKKRFDFCQGDVAASFAINWGWIRQCGTKDLNFNLSGMPSPRWGMGWTKRVGVAWFTKDPATGKTLPQALPYKVLTNGSFPNESIYAYYLNDAKGVDFCNGRTADIYNLFGSDKFKGGSYKDLNTLTDYTAGTVTYKNNKGVSITWNGKNKCVNC